MASVLDDTWRSLPPALPSVLDDPEVAARRKPLSDVLRELDAQEAREAGIEAVAGVVDATKAIEDRAMGRLQARPTEANLEAVRRLQTARAFNEPIQPPASGSTPEESMAYEEANRLVAANMRGASSMGRLVGAERADANGLPPNTLDGAINRLQSSLGDLLALSEYIERMAAELNPEKAEATQAEPRPPRPSGLLPALSHDLSRLEELLKRARMAVSDVSHSLGVD